MNIYHVCWETEEQNELNAVAIAKNAADAILVCGLQEEGNVQVLLLGESDELASRVVAQEAL